MLDITLTANLWSMLCVYLSSVDDLIDMAITTKVDVTGNVL